MQDNLVYLFAAFFVTWLIMGGYLLSLRRQVENVREEVEALRREQRESVALSGLAPGAPDSSRVAASEEG
uniref:CcmD family protein n=2 Tax=Thermorudis TaxID=1649508 RepID=A0A7C3A933_9BACT